MYSHDALNSGLPGTEVNSLALYPQDSRGSLNPRTVNYDRGMRQVRTNGPLGQLIRVNLKGLS